MTSEIIGDVEVRHLKDTFVGGAWTSADGPELELVSPLTEGVITRVRLPGPGNADSAVRVASEHGMHNWATLEVAERVTVCRRFCDAMEARLPDMETVWAVEAGMPIRYSSTLHRFGAVDGWSVLIDSAPEVLKPQVRTSPVGQIQIHREAAGVVLAVLSSNAPLVTVATKVVAALLAGCPVVVKAAVESQLIMRVVAECADDAGFPTGALSILCADADIGRRLSTDPRVDMVSLTGGPRAAQEIIEATRERLARTHLELGGKGPAIILDDAPLDAVMRSLVPGATGGTGQVCALLSRVLVSEKRHDEVVERLRTAWGALRIGNPLDRETRVGPMINEAAVRRTEGFVARAQSEGATVVAGGRRPPGFDQGWFYEPTLLDNVKESYEVANVEVFGPVTVVLAYEDLDDAIRIANGTDYGLSATVYSSDLERALGVARSIRAGSVAINTFGPSMTAPYGGVKGSGWGREAGAEGVLEFTEIKQVLIAGG